MIKTKDKIILASGSSTRKMMLEQSGIEFEIIKADLDEDKLKAEFIKSHGQVDPLKLGLELAKAKALLVSTQNPTAYVIAADQVCFMEGEIFDKPGTLENCILHLKKLRGHQHSQNCSCVLVHDGNVIWQHCEQALLKMHDLSDREIEIYVNHEKPSFACGSYMLENYGKHLFEYIHGDHDVVLGLPLLALLTELRRLGLILFN